MAGSLIKWQCPKCQNRTTKKSLEEKGMCGPCKRLEELRPFVRHKVRDFIARRHGRDGVRWDGVLAEVRKRYRPPPGVKQWELWHIVEIDSQRLNWGS
jgi:hypothetical protein